MRHSPGPWEHDYGDIGTGDALADPPTYRVVCRKDWRYSHDDPQWQADARLIAAAPELLAMLKEACGSEGSMCARCLHLIDTCDTMDRCMGKEARALIARIEGTEVPADDHGIDRE